MGSWGVPLARIFSIYYPILAQLRKCQVVMIGYATLWLYEACSGTRLGARVARVCASIIACSLAIGSGRPATTSGVAILGACSRSGHVADAQVGEIPGYARQPPPTGVAEMSASGHRLRRRRRGGRCAAPWDYLFYRANRANGANGHF